MCHGDCWVLDNRPESYWTSAKYGQCKLQDPNMCHHLPCFASSTAIKHGSQSRCDSGPITLFLCSSTIHELIRQLVEHARQDPLGTLRAVRDYGQTLAKESARQATAFLIMTTPPQPIQRPAPDVLPEKRAVFHVDPTPLSPPPTASRDTPCQPQEFWTLSCHHSRPPHSITSRY